MMCLGVGLFVSNLSGILWTFWTCVTFSFTRLGRFQSLFLQIGSPLLALLLLLLGFLQCGCYASCWPKCFLNSHFLIFFSFCCSAWESFSTSSSKSLIWSSASSNLLFIPSSVLFILDFSFFIFYWTFYVVWMSLFYTVEYTYNPYSKLFIW